MSHLRLGDSLDKGIDMGAIVDPAQRRSVETYVERARQEGAEVSQIWLLVYCCLLPFIYCQVYQACASIPSKGCFYPPTLITNVQPVSKVVQEEIFGPVLSVLTFRTTKEAIALANNTVFGLASSVWTENVSLALEVALNLKVSFKTFLLPVWLSGVIRCLRQELAGSTATTNSTLLLGLAATENLGLAGTAGKRVCTSTFARYGRTVSTQLSTRLSSLLSGQVLLLAPSTPPS